MSTATEVFAKLSSLSDNWDKFVNEMGDWAAGPDKISDPTPPVGCPAGQRPLTDSAGNVRYVHTPAEQSRIAQGGTP